MYAHPPIDCARPSPEIAALSKSASRARLAEIIRKRSFGRGEITLASGRKSDFYFNLKPTMLDPEGASLLAELTFEALKDDGLDYVGGLEMGAVPLAGAIAQLSWIKGHPIAGFFVRKKPKEHGAPLPVEGRGKRRGRHPDRRLGAEGGRGGARCRRRGRTGIHHGGSRRRRRRNLRAGRPSVSLALQGRRIPGGVIFL